MALVVLVSGAAWVLFISLINALVQNLAPDWVRARVLAIFTLVYMGSFALGSAAWGGVAQHQSVRLALACSGFGTVGSAILALFATGVAMWLRGRRRSANLGADWLGPIARRAGCPLGPSVTLTDIRFAIGVRVGPRTEAVVADIERSRFAPGPHETVAGGRARIFGALLRDLGLLRSLRFWLSSYDRGRMRE